MQPGEARRACLHRESRLRGHGVEAVESARPDVQLGSAALLPDLCRVRHVLITENLGARHVDECGRQARKIRCSSGSCVDRDGVRFPSVAEKRIPPRVVAAAIPNTETVDLVGVNNRNLKTFVTDLSTSVRLSTLIPDSFVKISESGLQQAESILALQQVGYQGFLIGETFMKTADPGAALADLQNDLSQLSNSNPLVL